MLPPNTINSLQRCKPGLLQSCLLFYNFELIYSNQWNQSMKDGKYGCFTKVHELQMHVDAKE